VSADTGLADVLSFITHSLTDETKNLSNFWCLFKMYDNIICRGNYQCLISVLLTGLLAFLSEITCVCVC
jgi:hypothetical protein